MAPQNTSEPAAGFASRLAPYATQVAAVFVCILCCGAIATAVFQAYVPGLPIQWSPSNSSSTMGNQKQAFKTHGLEQSLEKLEGVRSQLLQTQQHKAAQKLSMLQQKMQEQLEKLQQTQDTVNDSHQLLKHVREGEDRLAHQIDSSTKELMQHLQQHTAADQQAQHNQNNTQGVICTVLRNEAAYVAEWVAFHMLLGATKIVIYNDNSTDALHSAVAPFGDVVDVIDIYKDMENVPGDQDNHRMGGRQDWAFDHCKRTYGSSNATGWFGIWDVDEFVFPCKRPAAKLHGNPLWDAWTSSTVQHSHGHELRCTIFGMNDADKPQQPGQLVLFNNVRRAADADLESIAAAQVWKAVDKGCDACHGCCNAHATKTMYDISKVADLTLWTHGTHTEEALIDKSWQKPHAGLCCNHYQFKSTAETRAKAVANLNEHYSNVANTEDAKKHYTMLVDTLIWQYLPDLVELLQSKGVNMHMPTDSAVNLE